MRKLRPVLVLALTALVATLVTAPAAARGGPPGEAGPPLQGNPPAGAGAQADAPDWFIDWDDVEDEAKEIRDWAEDAGVPIQVETGEIAGAAYIATYPAAGLWNGDLVMYAHGYRGTGPRLFVDPAPAYEYLSSSGFAWAASSYRRNDYDPGIGMVDTKNLTRHVESVLRQRDDEELDKTYITGFSMGGHVTAAAIEHYPRLYDGAMPACGVLGDVELFDYFLDYNLGAAAFAGIPPSSLDYPSDDWTTTTVPSIKAELSSAPDGYWALDGALPAPLLTNPPTFFGAPEDNLLVPKGEAFKEFVEEGSGGDRVTFDAAWDYWHSWAGLPSGDLQGDFFFDLGEGDGTIANRPGRVAQNTGTDYEAEYGIEQEHFDILRLDAAKRVRNAQGVKPAILIDGDPSVPVLSIHTTGDLFVPIEMEQIYAEEVVANGKSDLLVQRAIRDIGHCSFTGEEIVAAYIALFDWVEGDLIADRPAGEIFTGDVLSQEDLGCEFTTLTITGGSGFRSFLEPCT